MSRATRSRTVLLLVALAALVVVAGALPWTRAEVAGALAGGGEVVANGGAAAPLVPALGLVALAGAAAASTTRRVGTVVALVAVALAGAGVLAGSALVLADPLAATTAEVGAVLGVTAGSVRAGDADVAATAWPVVTLVLGVLLAAAAAAGAVVSPRWARDRRHEVVAAGAGSDGDDAAPAAPADPAAERVRRRGEAFDAWDALSRGEDPTGGGAGPRP